MTSSGTGIGTRPRQDAPAPRVDLEAWLDTVTKLLRVPAAERLAIREELASHVGDRVTDLMVLGLTEDQAVRRAVEEFGDAATLAQSFGRARRGFIRRHLMHASLFLVAGSALGLSVVAINNPGLIPGGLPNKAEAWVAPSRAEEYFKEGEAPAFKVPAGVVSVASVIEQTAEQLGLALAVDWSMFDDVEGGAAAVVVEIAAEIDDVDALFDAINQQIDGPNRLDYRLRDGVMVVDTQETFDRREIVLVTYDIADVEELVRSQRAATAGGQSPFTIGALGDNILDTLSRHVSTNLWDKSGGDLVSGTAFGNKLFISAPARVHPQIAWMLDQMRPEAEPADAGPMGMEVVSLRHAPADEVGSTLQATFHEDSPGSPWRTRQLVVVDKATNVIILNAPEKLRVQMRELANQLDGLAGERSDAARKQEVLEDLERNREVFTQHIAGLTRRIAANQDGPQKDSDVEELEATRRRLIEIETELQALKKQP